MHLDVAFGNSLYALLYEYSSFAVVYSFPAYAFRLVYVDMLACSDRKGTVRKTVAELAARSHCGAAGLREGASLATLPALCLPRPALEYSAASVIWLLGTASAGFTMMRDTRQGATEMRKTAARFTHIPAAQLRSLQHFFQIKRKNGK